MTAKSRRRKFDKRRKSDANPQPRRRKEDDGSPEGPRGRTGFRADYGFSDEAATFDEVRVVKDARLHSVSLVGEGQDLSIGFIEIKPEDIDWSQYHTLHEVDPNEYNFAGGWPEGSRIYLNDSEKELFDKVHAQRTAEIEEVVRTPGPPHTKTSS